MPLFSVNMAVPVKENVRESQIYFLASSENMQEENHIVDKKYLIFKTFELITALCALMLFAYGMRATENEIGDMVKYVTLGVVTIYPLLFILLSVNVKQRPVFAILFNTSAMIALLVISATTISSSWSNKYYLSDSNTEKYSETLMQLRSSFLLLAGGGLYLVESLVMCYDIGKLYFRST